MTNNKINLDNNFYLELNDNKKFDMADITNLKDFNIKTCKNLILYIDFNNLPYNNLKKLVKNIFHIKKLCKSHHIPIGKKKIQVIFFWAMLQTMIKIISNKMNLFLH